ncbi:MAG: C45 family autoproteolytic acyltransferase/hydrolase [Dehalococcoidia bacterium]|nr:C45 family autoproteolytic acyltransferase/hydrolase [Dehalococcoidia bacterium]
MAAAHYPVIEVGGSPYERGRQHGEQARDRVAQSIEIYRDRFARTAGLQWDEAVEHGRGFGASIEALDPDIHTELRGIADGAGFTLDEIVAVNCRTEILFGARNRERGQAHEDAHECTTVGVPPNGSAGGKTLLGKNWDWTAACQDSVIVVRAEVDEGPNFVMVVEAGMVGRDGLNEDGIAVTGNLLNSTKDGQTAGIPVPIVRRRVFNSRSLDAALRAVLDADRAASTNYVIAHESGVIINFEASPEQVYPVYPENGLLTHSNHFLAVAAQVQGIDCATGGDTLYRHRRARDLLESKAGALTVEDIQEALRDHAGYPLSICRHVDAERGNAGTASIASIVMDVAERTVYVASGPPCSNEYRAVTVPGSTQSAATAGAAAPAVATPA